LRLFTWFACGHRRFVLAQKLAGFFGRVWAPRSEWMKLPAFTGWGYSKDFPRPAGNTFRDRWQARTTVSSEPLSFSGDQRSVTEEPGSRQPGLEPVACVPQSLIPRFQTELETLGGKFVRCSESELAARILALLAEREIDRVMGWEDAHLPIGLVDALRRQGVHVQNEPDPKITAGITGAVAGVAETGTLVVTSGHGRPQSTSLLPELHIAILRESDLQKNLAQVLNLRKVREASTVSLISGPSKTADIEMTLTIGVHGPGEVIVFCV